MGNVQNTNKAELTGNNEGTHLKLHVGALETLFEGFSLQHLHRNVRNASVVAVIQDLYDVRTSERSSSFRFPEKPLHDIAVADISRPKQVHVDQFNCNSSAQASLSKRSRASDRPSGRRATTGQ